LAAFWSQCSRRGVEEKFQAAPFKGFRYLIGRNNSELSKELLTRYGQKVRLNTSAGRFTTFGVLLFPLILKLFAK